MNTVKRNYTISEKLEYWRTKADKYAAALELDGNDNTMEMMRYAIARIEILELLLEAQIANAEFTKNHKKAR